MSYSYLLCDTWGSFRRNTEGVSNPRPARVHMTMAVRAKPKGKTVRVRTFRLLGFALFETARALQSGAGGPYAAASYGGRSSSQQQIRQAPDQVTQRLCVLSGGAVGAPWSRGYTVGFRENIEGLSPLAT